MARLDPAATVMLDVVRGGERRGVTLSANVSANPSAAVPATPSATASSASASSATASSATASATPSAQQAPARALGLTLQAVSRVGSEVILVDADSVAALAGVRPGDVILSVGGIGAPSPAQVTRAFDTRDAPVLAGIRRGTGHRVVVLD